jgi:hypothetical protein
VSCWGIISIFEHKKPTALGGGIYPGRGFSPAPCRINGLRAGFSKGAGTEDQAKCYSTLKQLGSPLE